VRALALLTVLLASSPARAGDGELGDGIQLHAAAQVRVRADRNAPGTAVRYDPGQGGLALSDYLVPRGQETVGSLLASIGLEGRHLDGALHWVLTADTGELRAQRRHGISQVCWSDSTASGLAQPGSGDCSLYRVGRLRWTRVVVPVEETALEPGAKLTANGRPFDEEVRHTLLLREAYASYRFGRAGFLGLAVGRKRMVVADGYVHDDYALGVELEADLGAIGPQWDLAASLFLPTRDFPEDAAHLSPMLVVRADYLPSLFDRAGIFVAGLRERSDSLASLYRGAVEERLVVAALGSDPGAPLHRRASQLLAATAAAPTTSDGVLGWAGTSGKLTPGRGQRLSWTAAVMSGRIRSVEVGQRSATLAEDVRVEGQLASVRWDVDLSRTLSGGASFLFLSGGQLPRARLGAGGELAPATGTYRAFLGVSPYLTETSIFFGGGLSETYADRQARAPGVNGRGVLAPIVSLRWDPAEGVTARARGAWLRAVEEGPFGGRQYGTELDLDVSWEATRWLVLAVEADALFPGDFFRGKDPVTRAILAVDVLTP
jgi:hypothetical protein